VADDEPLVLARRRGRVGQITLNRPRALNALNHDMVRLMHEALDRFVADDKIGVIVVDGAGERGLCAGGDIRAVYEDAVGKTGLTAPFWADEYRLNLAIDRLPKPYVALMDGIVMGGGVGISSHGTHRVVTQRTQVAMPEVRIGLIPDVGATHLLAKAPDNAGLHLAMTAGTIDGADAIYAGLADDYVHSSDLPELLQLLEKKPIEQALSAVRREVPASALALTLKEIGHCYDGIGPLLVLKALESCGTAAALSAAESIRSHSPTAVWLAMRGVRTAATLPGLGDCLDLEYRLMLRRLHDHDAREGIRAQIIDKDRSPTWEPASLAEVSADAVASHFLSLGELELGLGVDE